MYYTRIVHLLKNVILFEFYAKYKFGTELFGIKSLWR